MFLSAITTTFGLDKNCPRKYNFKSISYIEKAIYYLSPVGF